MGLDNTVMGCIAHAERVVGNENEARNAAAKVFQLLNKKGISLSRILAGAQPSSVLVMENIRLKDEVKYLEERLAKRDEIIEIFTRQKARYREEGSEAYKAKQLFEKRLKRLEGQLAKMEFEKAQAEERAERAEREAEEARAQAEEAMMKAAQPNAGAPVDAHPEISIEDENGEVIARKPIYGAKDITHLSLLIARLEMTHPFVVSITPQDEDKVRAWIKDNGQEIEWLYRSPMWTADFLAKPLPRFVWVTRRRRVFFRDEAAMIEFKLATGAGELVAEPSTSKPQPAQPAAQPAQPALAAAPGSNARQEGAKKAWATRRAKGWVHPKTKAKQAQPVPQGQSANLKASRNPVPVAIRRDGWVK